MNKGKKRTDQRTKYFQWQKPGILSQLLFPEPRENQYSTEQTCSCQGGKVTLDGWESKHGQSMRPGGSPWDSPGLELGTPLLPSPHTHSLLKTPNILHPV